MSKITISVSEIYILVEALPDVCCELLPVLYKHLWVAGLRRILLMFLRDVEGHGELGFTCGAGSRVHTARYRGRHVHFDLCGSSSKLRRSTQAAQILTQQQHFC